MIEYHCALNTGQKRSVSNNQQITSVLLIIISCIVEEVLNEILMVYKCHKLDVIFITIFNP